MRRSQILIILLSAAMLDCRGSGGGSGAESANSAILPKPGDGDHDPGPPPPATCPAQRSDGFAFPPDLTPGATAVAGGTAGSFSVTNDGDANYSIPLVAPQGRAGMQPNLAVTLSSSAPVGLFGKGAVLSGLSAVQRCGSSMAQDNQIRAVQYDAQDHFCFAGARLVQISSGIDPSGDTVYEYRTYPDSFAKVLAHFPTGWNMDNGPSYFEIDSKDGTISTYSTRTTVPGGVAGSWLLTSTRDRRSNSVTYLYGMTWDTSGNTIEYWPTEIDYTKSPSAAANRKVTFEYLSKSLIDHRSFEAGVSRRQTKLISSITMHGPVSVVRTYSFAYHASQGTSWPLLDSVTECAPSGCKIPTTFTWNDHGGDKLVDQPVANTTLAQKDWSATWLLLDVNGDGLADLVTSSTDPGNSDISDWYVSINVGGKFSTAALWAQFPFPVDTLNQVGGPNPQWNWRLMPIDYDQDGRMDIVLDSWALPFPDGHIHWLHSLPNYTFELLDTGIPTPAPKDVETQPLQYAVYHSQRLADVNGDGVADLIECDDPAADVRHFWSTDPLWKIHLWSKNANNTSKPGWQQLWVSAPSAYDKFPCFLGQGHMISVDTDGDGRSDFLGPSTKYPTNNPDGTVNWGYYTAWQLNSNNSWTGKPLNLPIQDSLALKPQFIDLNGDGYVDALYPWEWTNVMLQSYTAWNWYTDPGELAIGQTTNDPWAPDLLFVIMNAGTGSAGGFPGGYQPTMGGSYSTPDAWTNAHFNASVSIDYNGDGQRDLLMAVPGSCDLRASFDICWDVLLSPPNGQDHFKVVHTYIHYDMPPLNTAGLRIPQSADIDGDGREEMVMVDLQGVFHVYKPGTAQDQLTDISDGMNVFSPGSQPFVPTVHIDYAPLVDALETNPWLTDPFFDVFYNPHTDPNNKCEFPHKCVVGTRQVVKGYNLGDGQGGAQQYGMRYRDGRYDENGRGSLGFGEVVTLDLLKGGGHATFFDNFTYDAVRKIYPNANQVAKAWSWQPVPSANQVELEYVTNTMNVIPTNNASSWYTLVTYSETKKEEQTFASTSPWPQGFYQLAQFTENSPGTILSDTWVSANTWDDYGNVQSMSSGVTGGDLLIWSTSAYDNNPASWLIGKQTSTLVCSNSMSLTQCRHRTVVYNSYGEPQDVTSGDDNDEETQLNIHRDRDVFGNVTHTTATDFYGNSRASCTSYEASGIFPYSTGNSLNQITHYKYDLGLGVLITSIDPNSLATQWAFDGFGRETMEKRPDGTQKTTAYKRAQFSGLWNTTVIESTSDAGWGSSQLDGAGRVVFATHSGTQVQSCSPSTCSSAPIYGMDLQYDSYGNLLKKSLPWLAGNPVTSRKYMSYQYDLADRVIEAAAPWNTTEYVYEGNQTQAFDSQSTHTTIVDALGRPETVIDSLAGVTKFSYGPFGAEWSVDNVGDTTQWVRDALGRPRTSIDPNRGTTTIDYDGFGDPTTLSDALGRSFTLQYDSIGRITSRLAPEGATTWQYDTAPLGTSGTAAGMLSLVTTPKGRTTQYGYTQYGQPQKEVLTIDSEEFGVSFSYDPLGHLSTVTYPKSGTPFTVVYDYDIYGNRIGVHDQTTGAQYWTLNSTNGWGEPSEESFLGKLSRRNEYDQVSRRISRELSGAGTNYFQDLRYHYDNHQNMLFRTDGLQLDKNAAAAVEHFQYDALDRLTCAWVDHTQSVGKDGQPKCNTAVTYLPNGNIDSKSDVGTYGYDPNHKHAVTSAGSLGFKYDDVGNQTSRADAAIIYTSFDLPSSYTLEPDQSLVTFEYDGGHQRIRKTDNKLKLETTYLGGLYERLRDLSTGIISHRYFVEVGTARMELTRQSGAADDISYVFPDVLGSTDVIADPAGNVKEHRSYDAFGQERDPIWDGPPNGPYVSSHTHGFTEQESEASLGLVNMNGRIYDPLLARFLQVDPFDGQHASSQHWNGYAYSLNNPLKFVDPTGWEEGMPDNSLDPVPVHPAEEAAQLSFVNKCDPALDKPIAPAKEATRPKSNLDSTGSDGGHIDTWRNPPAADPSFIDRLRTESFGNAPQFEETVLTVEVRPPHIQAGNPLGDFTFDQQHRDYEYLHQYDPTPEQIHLGLDVVGFFPVVGSWANGVNAVLYTAEGRYGAAALSAAAAIPGVGLVKGIKVAAKAAKAGKAVKAASNGARLYSDVRKVKEVAQAGTASRAAIKLWREAGYSEKGAEKIEKAMQELEKEFPNVDYARQPGTGSVKPSIGRKDPKGIPDWSKW